MASSNIINAVFGSGLCAVTTSAFRANYGMVLRFSGIDLPTAFECDFSNYDTMGRDSITAIGQNNEVQIPDDLWDSGLNIYAYVYLHPTDDSGVTVYTVTIPVLGRPNRTDEEPTPHEQTVIEQAISALNDAVEQTAADVASADASASAAAQSEANASVSERAAAASASAALASQNAAESAAQGATESASGASESARNAAVSASAAAESATSAQASAEQAERSVQSITDDVERAERAAATATGKATEAASSAATATGKATEATSSAATASTKAAQAEQSATAAAQSASSASTAAQNAASSATAAESSATDAETAKQDAQDAKEAAEAAQAAAEQAAESVSGLSAQIEQNTADIAELVQSKAGALIDTATGSIASFVPDSTVPTVKGLTVNVEPQQDLHGYDAPWPAGGGKNLFNYENTGITLASMGQTGPVFSNTNTDSRTFFNFQFRALNNGTVVVTSDAQSISSTGRKSATITISETITHVSIVHNGSKRNLSVTYPFTGQGTFTISFDVTAYNPSSVGGLSFKDVQIELGSTATAYAPYSNICPISGWDAVEVWNDPKYGGTVAWNQLVQNGNFADTSNWGVYTPSNGTVTVSDNVATITYSASSTGGGYAFGLTYTGATQIQTGHKYFLKADVNPDFDTEFDFELGTSLGFAFSAQINSWTEMAVVAQRPSWSQQNILILKPKHASIAVGSTLKVRNFQLIDLTLLFGSTIADYIYNLERATTGAGVAYFRNLFPKDYYPFDDSYTETCVSAVNGDAYSHYQIQLGQTVYGGKIDATNGVLTVTKTIITLDDSTYNKRFHGAWGETSNGYAVYWSRDNPRNSRAISNLFSYSKASYINMPVGTFGGGSGVSETWTFVLPSTITNVDEANSWLADNAIQIVTPLATPITISLTPLEISVLTGQTNNIWADCGDVSVEYAADLKTYIDQKIAAAVAALS